jgi:hypothetical protein
MYDPREYVVPVRLFADATDQTLDDIERMGPRERLTQVLLLGQLAAFRVGVRPLDARTKRTVALLYDKVFESFTDDDLETRQPLRLDSDIMNLVETAFADWDDNKRFTRFERDFGLSETAFWGERERMLPYVLENERCEIAALLVAYVRNEHALHPDAYKAQRIPDPNEQIAAMQESVEQACTDVVATGGPP